ncbi:GAF domain-containing protein [Adhaeribacter radiodurans]|uniref:GAF domain-containing protein n=1 Tax=Adhaeribacter radiodurans TaxID=2745197 RepID=A0A7L7L7W5_9BACT|nr:GAF domain-containing protein [Adhaeribacter radiodurans]QMU28916.1 GAF domain-containing protein [Adhaeribacter radiodurans]
MDIPTSKNYDSEFCGSLPLHFINLVQPHGFIMVVQKETFLIRQISENVIDLLGTTPTELLNRNLADIILPEQMEVIRRKTQQWNIEDRIPENVSFTINNAEQKFSAVIHTKENYILLELEPNVSPVTSSELDFVHIYQEIMFILAAFKKADSIQKLSQIAVSEIKKLSGFDRVMIYQFDKNWNGSVLAEALEPDMQPYLNLCFPASDVPRNARDLYLKNSFRLIPNREYTPARLVPVLNPISSNFTDLSDCNLRSVANVHLQYLKNMGVQASMSTPIVKDNVLWGLISCHHKTPKNLSFEMRSAFVLLSSIISAQVVAKENEYSLGQINSLNDIFTRLLAQMYNEQDFRQGLVRGAYTLNQLFTSSGAAVVLDGEIKKVGKTPTNEEIKSIVHWLQRSRVNKIHTTENLAQALEPAVNYKEVASGLIALPIALERGDYILGFREEMVQTISWGGNPNQAITMEPDGKTYHPRNSFAVWQEQVKHTSLPWSEQDVHVAEQLRIAVLERIVRDTH